MLAVGRRPAQCPHRAAPAQPLPRAPQVTPANPSPPPASLLFAGPDPGDCNPGRPLRVSEFARARDQLAHTYLSPPQGPTGSQVSTLAACLPGPSLILNHKSWGEGPVRQDSHGPFIPCGPSGRRWLVQGCKERSFADPNGRQPKQHPSVRDVRPGPRPVPPALRRHGAQAGRSEGRGPVSGYGGADGLQGRVFGGGVAPYRVRRTADR